MTAVQNIPQPQAEPGVATAEDGYVILDGPDGLAVTMTAAAAKLTGQSLIHASGIAEAQLANRAPQMGKAERSTNDTAAGDRL